MDRLRRLLNRQVSISALVEVAFWLAIPYLCIGLVWATVHENQVERIEARLMKVMPAGADIAAFGVTALLWPASLQIADACPAA
ncbi:hypothetical protein A5634_15550 [Mycobacterium asiaticum]|uniref:Uncharacterized protein n=1 Tax=Mycobacterium asiaticum TaxID=1790 RepID=A0A1A3P959_MYCAS|nr:hypothetical protein [Mycobacterium asiaticum]OBK30696.1 hypothetical protein A5634_15550 [Mycobacterium asiaticum]